MKYILLFVLLVSYCTVHSQLYCENYDVRDGLLSDQITAIKEDSKGYIYIGTSAGLSYFDGVDFISISDKGVGDVPHHVFVERIQFDKYDNLWMSTEHNGLYRYNKQSNSWINFSNEETNNYQIPNNVIWQIDSIENKLIVACEGNGLVLIDIKTLEVSTNEKLENHTITDIFKNSDGSLLLTTKRAIYKVQSLEHIGAMDTIYEATPTMNLMETYVLSNNSMYTTTYQKGVYEIINGDAKKIQQPNDFDTWRYNYIGEYDGRQWLTLLNHGLVTIDLQSKEWNINESKPYSKNTLPKGKYSNGLVDSRNILWVATSKGLSKINLSLQAFENIENDEVTNEFMLEAFYDEVKHMYVMLYASEKNKVKFFDDQFNVIAAYNHTPEVSYIQSLHDLIPFGNNYLCLGHEIMHIDGNTSKIDKARLKGFDKINNPRAITLDKENNLWVVHGGNKVMRYSLQKQEILDEMRLPNLGLSSGINYSIRGIEDCGDFMSLTARDIFLTIDKASLKVDVYRVDEENISIVKVDQYPQEEGSIMQVKKHGENFFISTRNEGFYKAIYSSADSEFTISANLSASEILGSVELEVDDQKDIWIATDNGLVLTDYDFKIKKRINGQDGLVKTKLNQGLSIANNKLILNSENGITVANMDLLKKEEEVLSVDIEKLSANNIPRSISDEETVLGHTQNNIRIDASMPVYSNAYNYKYAYRLRPTVEDWSQVKVFQKTFRYDNLQPGEYTFEIKALVGNREGQMASLSFVINPPFWKTWWFSLLTILGLLTGGIWAYQARVRAKVNQEKVKTKLAELQNEAIRAQLNPHFIFNALNSIRSLILMNKKDGSLNYLGRFSILVREVLSISKEESIPLSRELSFNENYVNIERLRFSQSFSYEVSVQEGIDVERINVPPLVMQPFIENAIWHGLLNKEGDALLKINIELEEDCLLISIDDNGVGRKKKISKALDTYKTRKAYGELLSKQRLESIGENAEIKIIDKVENSIPQGTTVIIKLPI